MNALRPDHTLERIVRRLRNALRPTAMDSVSFSAPGMSAPPACPPAFRSARVFNFNPARTFPSRSDAPPERTGKRATQPQDVVQTNSDLVPNGPDGEVIPPAP